MCLLAYNLTTSDDVVNQKSEGEFAMDANIY